MNKTLLPAHAGMIPRRLRAHLRVLAAPRTRGDDPSTSAALPSGTLGPDGVFYRFGDKTGHVAGVPCKVGDTNGAGDTFFGAALSKLCKEELDTLTVDKLEGILAFANKAASITTSRHGAIPAMPTLAEVEG